MNQFSISLLGLCTSVVCCLGCILSFVDETLPPVETPAPPWSYASTGPSAVGAMNSEGVELGEELNRLSGSELERTYELHARHIVEAQQAARRLTERNAVPVTRR
jgi:hypothetical protein